MVCFFDILRVCGSIWCYRTRVFGAFKVVDLGTEIECASTLDDYMITTIYKGFFLGILCLVFGPSQLANGNRKLETILTVTRCKWVLNSSNLGGVSYILRYSLKYVGMSTFVWGSLFRWSFSS